MPLLCSLDIDITVLTSSLLSLCPRLPQPNRCQIDAHAHRTLGWLLVAVSLYTAQGGQTVRPRRLDYGTRRYGVWLGASRQSLAASSFQYSSSSDRHQSMAWQAEIARRSVSQLAP